MMLHEFRQRLLGCAVLLSLACTLNSPTHAQSADPQAPSAVRLYTMDCGRIAIADMGAFDDSGASNGKASTLISPCYLIRHPKGDLLWDAGIGDTMAKLPGGKILLPGFIATVPTTMAVQLAQLSVSTQDIEFFAFSHGHVDHLGNAAAMTSSTWFVNQRELDYLAQPGSEASAALVARRDPKRTKIIAGDFDVFGDGSVIILQTPGHTPGHQSLFIRLAHAGPMVLSGDLYHSRDNRAGHRVPAFNSSRAETLASMDRIEKLLVATGAKLVIQHAMEDFKAAPKVPSFID